METTQRIYKPNKGSVKISMDASVLGKKRKRPGKSGKVDLSNQDLSRFDDAEDNKEEDALDVENNEDVSKPVRTLEPDAVIGDAEVEEFLKEQESPSGDGSDDDDRDVEGEETEEDKDTGKTSQAAFADAMQKILSISVPASSVGFLLFFVKLKI